MSGTARLKRCDLERIFSRDAETRLKKTAHTSRWNYLVPLDDGGVKIFTVSVRWVRAGSGARRAEARVIATQNPRRKTIFLRNVAFVFCSGWQTQWDCDSGECSWRYPWRFGCGAGFPFEEVVNPEALERTRYAHCGWEARKGVGLSDYLRLWETDPRVERVAKAGLWDLVKPGCLARLGRSRAFFSFVREHADEIRGREYSAREIVYASSRGVSPAAAALHFAALRVFALVGGLPREACARAEKHLEWVNRFGRKEGVGVLRDYARFLRYAAELGWDFGSEAVFPPRKRFREILDGAEADVMRARDQKEAGGLKRARERFGALDGIRAGSLSATVPFTRAEFRAEGKAMKNCLFERGYAEKVARGESLVVFLRRDGKPYADMEIRLGGGAPKLVQLYGERNGEVSAEAEGFASLVTARARRLARNNG